MTPDVASPPLPLFFDLTVPSERDKPPAALYLSEYLVKLIGSEVTTFRRNTLASYLFVDTAHRVVTELQKLIDEVFKKGTTDSFWKWTKALTPLEKLLLEFKRDDFIGSDQLVEVSKGRTVCRTDLDNWKKARGITHTKLESLHNDAALNVLDPVKNQANNFKDVYWRDDKAFLDDLVSDIKMQPIPQDLNLPETFKKSFNQVTESVTKIANLFGQKKFTSDEEASVVVQSTMAICGWSHFTTKSDKDPIALEKDVTTLKFMQSDPVCLSAQSLLKGLIDLSERKMPLASVEALYTEFINLAFGLPSVSCVDLMKLLSDIGRAYHAQALALITLCEKAVTYCNGPPGTKDATEIQKIGEALDQTSKALVAAAETAKESVATLSLPQWTKYEVENYDEDGRSQRFQTTMATIATKFADIDGISTAMSEGKTNFQEAVKEDKRLTKLANERVAAINAPEKAITVTVDVRQGTKDGTALLKPLHTVRVGSSTLISAIEWGVSNLPAVKDQLEGKFTHFKSGGNTIAKHQKINELGPTEPLALVMVVTDSQPTLENGDTTSATTTAVTPP
ncbi:hypothetical protein FRC12_018756 [Ceratobasidium sp. 428]|nr:hypothetical protein FRC12_018756 [Ceratobasidium sp. 428]